MFSMMIKDVGQEKKSPSGILLEKARNAARQAGDQSKQLLQITAPGTEMIGAQAMQEMASDLQMPGLEDALGQFAGGVPTPGAEASETIHEQEDLPE